ncbi:expressed unknown protein [Seminavis robusta]|uniref:Uncharacterized protein n=1 Tax=Seminavis robusta TaxID=568900 RepID=A0A9N8DJK2_9STRA|nr:expressed unknown protein [Seminavis robusta]|eukprot:Sro157_g071130.1 n/a (93) ;mRNA; f:38172-38450
MSRWTVERSNKRTRTTTTTRTGGGADEKHGGRGRGKSNDFAWTSGSGYSSPVTTWTAGSPMDNNQFSNPAQFEDLDFPREPQSGLCLDSRKM